KRTMTCVDCHNRVGHPFAPPEQLVDSALAQSGLSQTLPFAKQEMMTVLNADYADQATALATVADELATRYGKDHPEVAAAHAADIQQAAQLAEELVTRVVFERPGITWQSFPNDSQHKYFPGCFRCHDGKHVSSGDESIRLHCNICHSIPSTIGPGVDQLELPVTMVAEPLSHLESNFMADHRFQANDGCATCHGPVTFGSDDSSFCANSACHGKSWPAVKLDAAFPHPIPLEGQHARVWCYQCHEGVRKPTYDCVNCHEPPSSSHYGENCGACHTPVGWRESAESMVLQSPPIPHPLEGRDNCLLCHDPSGQVQPAPADHAGRTNAQCAVCHQPAQ
ncbi:MAG: hypothetical protein KJ734_05780, partial [Chloroflexi bacterium]|nr:hypothetical protein [Chloroflexota bacterium]